MVIKDIDIFCVGETIVDLIGIEAKDSIKNTNKFERHLGGSPTNVALNCSKLKLKVALASSVGEDNLGNYIHEELIKNQIDISCVKLIDNMATSIILVSKTTETPDFIPYRNADYYIYESQIKEHTILRSKIFHTTCFALSRDPAQTTILKYAELAYKNGSKTSIDLNFSSKIWTNRDDALKVIMKYCKYNPLIKISLDDMHRIFGSTMSENEMFAFFHNQNVDLICLTKGKEGVVISERNKKTYAFPSIKIPNIKDATGAGDAFWSGFLYGFIHEFTIEKSVQTGLLISALKLQGKNINNY
ncbi:fructokinase [Tenacibaculum skagerrakense]|uniref:Fructokinase n=1 Tax=Tenacibaculum skagerrakense TaxID=186571 RepID=A0A4R2P3W0_9FLAO|nr:PfkB family carbohydrate kinase [Tenacibaculum skagerrakense]TCP28611.1 fructokinase [Tenacibaculum skagerrakense]